MPKDKDYLIELILNKLKNNNNSNKINLEKKEITEFINSLINKN